MDVDLTIQWVRDKTFLFRIILFESIIALWSYYYYRKSVKL